MIEKPSINHGDTYSDVVSLVADTVVNKPSSGTVVGIATTGSNVAINHGLSLLEKAPYATPVLNAAGKTVLLAPGVIIDWSEQVGREGTLQGTVSSLGSSGVGLAAGWGVDWAAGAGIGLLLATGAVTAPVAVPLSVIGLIASATIAVLAKKWADEEIDEAFAKKKKQEAKDELQKNLNNASDFVQAVAKKSGKTEQQVLNAFNSSVKSIDVRPGSTPLIDKAAGNLAQYATNRDGATGSSPPLDYSSDDVGDSGSNPPDKSSGQTITPEDYAKQHPVSVVVKPTSKRSKHHHHHHKGFLKKVLNAIGNFISGGGDSPEGIGSVSASIPPSPPATGPATSVSIVGTDFNQTLHANDSITQSGDASLKSIQPPLILDLQNNGVETISYKDSNALFDFEGDGFIAKTSWVSKNDALLAIDWNQNDIIDNVNELFGYTDSTGFDELRGLDSNKDNIIDTNDVNFNLLRVWQDANQDGVTDSGELKTLLQAGIQSIGLTTRTENYYNNNNLVSESAIYTRTDGTTSRVYDVFFAVDGTSTQPASSYNISLDLFNMPWVRGYGHVQDLLVEATNNSALKALIKNLYNDSNLVDIYHQMETLLSLWADTGIVGQVAMANTDPAKVEFLSKFLNINFAEDATNSNYKTVIDQTYQDLKNKIFIDFIAQTQLGYFLGMSYDFSTDTHSVDNNVFYNQIVENLTNTQASFASFVIAKTLLGANILDIALLSDSVTRHGYGDILISYLQNPIDPVIQNADGSVTGDALDNLIYSTSQSLSGVLLQGNDGNDLLVSTIGNDTLQGGTGNDTYVIDLQSGQDVISDTSGTEQLLLGNGITKDNLILSQSGNDLVLTVGTQVLATIQNFYPSGAIETIRFMDGTSLTSTAILAMTSTINGTTAAEVIQGNNFVNIISGDAGNDTITAGAGNDTIDGGSGADSMLGGTGDDTYTVDDAGDVIVENLFEGTDTVQSSVSYTLSANVENLTLTGSSSINATGNASSNILTGNSGANILTGGLGNDTYVMTDTLDTVVENANEGTDTVQTSVSYTLGSNLENLTLTGAAALTGSGNSANNVLTGNNASSTLIGGAGDDTYIVQNSGTVITENANEGTDTVQTSVSYTLANNLENLTLTGTNAIAGAGNSGNNTLIGNNAASTLSGGLGDDTYVVMNAGTVITENASEGTDTVQTSVSYTLSADVENLTLTGSTAINGTGNSLNNTLIGNTADNILDGGSGADSLTGGLGNDTYVVDDAGDVITENTNEGTDTVQASISYTLGSNLENLTLTGTSALSGVGNGSNNVLTGNNTASTLAGGLGDDTYVVQNSGTVITENANEGTDTVQTSVSYTLASNLENLTLTGTSALSGVGNGSNNVLTGNNAASTLAGGLGDDTYVVQNAGTVITENASEGTDTVQSSVSYTLANNLENLTLTGTANLQGVGNTLNNTMVGNAGNNTLDGGAGADTFAGGLGDDVYLVDNAGDVITENASEGIDTVQSSVSYTLVDYVENLTLTGTSDLSGTGSNYHNQIIGNSGNNLLKGLDGDDTLDGGAGIDTLIGGTGDDVYTVDNASDVIQENLNEGTDTVQSSINWTLGANVENLALTGSSNLAGTGNALDNVLTGNTGTDTLIGGLGDDTYILQNAATVVTENVSEGTDTVQIGASYTLGTNVENLTLTGSSNLLGVGNAANNILTANSGVDTLIGGAGDDTYIISNAGTSITENATEGTDTVSSSVSFTLGANLENLILTGIDDVNATGNSVSNILSGNAGNNILDGGAGADTMTGGQGNDIYVVDNAGDVINEDASEGVDTVQSSLSYTLSEFLENLTLTGSSSINGTGTDYDNALTGSTGNNVLTGLAGNDTLDGGTGADSLTGGTGDDTYVVDNTGDVVTENAAEGTDTVQSSINWTLGNNLEYLFLTGTNNTTGTGNTGDNWIVGNTGTNVLTGLAGNDTLDGGAGTDTLVGGTGNDLYLVDNAGDVVTENANEGTDAVQTSISYTLGNNVENLSLTGTANLIGTGNSLNNTLIGNSGQNTLTSGAGDDVLDGGVGADSLIGGTGNDTYVVDNAGDVVTENASEGIDSVLTKVSYTLASNVENLTLLGTADLQGVGNTLGNEITGNAGSNILDGGSGVDTLLGGAGDDTYLVDNTNDVIIENTNEGTDTVEASANYALTSNVENLVLVAGSSATQGTGNKLDNVIVGNGLANTLSGGDGNDSLDGSTGADTLIGGTGNDTYVVDNAGDVITENTNEGTDTVYASVNYTLASNVENLTLTDGSNLTGTGNSLDNVLTGNTGTDTLVGGTGNDTYVIQNATTVITENANEGIDTVQTDFDYTLGSNLENLTLLNYNDLKGTGNSLNNVLTGNYGDNTLDGGTGADTMLGGLGDDVYVVDNASDVVTENTNEGIDTVQSSISYTLGSNLENLTLTGSTNLIGKGNTQDNILSGNTGIDTLIGGTGNDTYVIQNASTVITENASEGTDTVQTGVSYTLGSNLENLTLTGSSNLIGKGNTLDNVITGNTGNSTLIGGTGNDTYVIQNATTGITENASEGTDTVQSSVSFTLGANLENLTLTGASAINGTGNTLNNVLTGNTANNVLTALDGNDTLDGGGGLDTLIGGAGNDTYIVNNTGVTITENANEGTDTVQASISYTLDANVENLTLTGVPNLNGTGNALNNTLTGNTGSNILDGGAGVDTLIGGQGNDTYVVDNASDVVTENANEGTDTVQSSINWTLGANLENLTLTGSSVLTGTGNSGDNVLTGNAGNSTLVGGLGNDTYVLQNATTGITESASAGTDTVQVGFNYTLGNNLENLTLTGAAALTGTGNNLDNTLTGNAANSTLIGGTGNDTYVIQNQDTVITENASEGTDTVQSSVHYTLGSNLENLTLTGTGNLSGTGNSQDNVLTGNSGINTLVGLVGNDTLDGGTGADFLYGGVGNDTYIVDNLGDLVVESAGEGTDTVQSSVSYTLGNNVENLTLTGTSGISGTGNSLNNTLTGNSGDNLLDGGAGNDTLAGGTGNDTYVLDSANDVINENANEGTDTVEVAFSYSLTSNLENLILTGGNALTIRGNSGNNTLTDNTGDSTLLGGAGNDTYVISSLNSVITENASEGTDTVQVNLSYTLGANLENLTLTGTDNLVGTGNTLNNVITGNSGNNTLDGSTGADTLVGGQGNDLYLVDNAGDVITENAGEGIDVVQSSVSYTLSNYVENLTLTGTANTSGTGNTYGNVITGNTGNNSLSGGAGNDTLDGGTGADTLVGGTGDDYFIVDSASDVLVENGSEGIDTVQASISYTLANYFENLILTGSALTGTGTAFDNLIIGNANNNTLTGLAGNDTLDGDAGVDTLIGGTGDDLYIVNNLNDVVTENANEGTDTVQSSVSYVLGANLEKLTLVGDAATGTGNAANNTIVGNTASNTLDGGTGADTLVGGLGDDVYLVDNTGDVVVEKIYEGNDTVQSSVDYTLSDNVNNLILTGTAAIYATGNTIDNVLTGNNQNNVLTGLDGNDTLDGGTGADDLFGGIGNDLYIVDNLQDAVYENANEGIDTVQSSVSYALGANVENLTLTGTNNIDGIGNSLDNVITSNSGRNVLDGGDGNDTYRLSASNGLDTIIDSSGNDTLDATAINVGLNIDLNANALTIPIPATASKSLLNINNLVDGSTSIPDLYGNSWIAEGNAAIGSSNPWKSGEKHVALDGNGDGIKTTGVNLTGNSYTIHWRQRFDNFGHMQYLLEGGTNQNTINIEHDGTKVILSAYLGSWTSINGSKTNWTANQWYDFEFSYSSTDGYKLFVDGVLDSQINNTAKTSDPGGVELGGARVGPNYSANGAISDVYVADSVLHAANFTPGTDSYFSQIQSGVVWTGSSIENAVGGSGNDVLTGTAGDNHLTGGLGNDSLIGGAGNDTYVFASGFGVDTINDAGGLDSLDFSAYTTAVSVNLGNTSFTDGSNSVAWGSNTIENLVTGSGNDSLTGNTGDNILSAGLGNDTLSGGSGNDSLIGGDGNDIYAFASGFGTDTVSDSGGSDTLDFSSYATGVTVNLGNTSFTDSGNSITWSAGTIENVNGGSGNDSLTGNASANTLKGGGGNDSLIGGDGNDVYVFNSGFGKDTITDSNGTDTLDFSSFTSGVNIDLNMSTASLPMTASTSKALLTIPGGNGSTGITDLYGNTWSAMGNAVVGSSSPWKAGEKHIVLDGNGDGIKSTGVNLTGNSYTIHWRQRFDNFSHLQYLVEGGAGTSSMTVQHDGGKMVIGFYAGSWVTANGGKTSWTTNQWYDFEFTYSSTGGYKLYVDGVLDAQISNTTKSNNPGGIDFGGDRVGPNFSANGAISDVYVTSDVLHTSNFTPSTENVTSLYCSNQISWSANDLENLLGGSGSDTLTGNSSGNLLQGNAGNDTLQGGIGNDTYKFAKGDGHDVVIENDTTSGNSDKLLFDNSVAQSNIAIFKTTSGDLQIGYTDSSGDLITVQGFDTAAGKVEKLELSTGNYLTDADINQIIADMASYATSHGTSLTSLDDVKNDNNLMAIVNGGWHA